jgi:hypothetical protein
MVGSPNYEKFIYNGTAATEISPNIRPGSIKLMVRIFSFKKKISKKFSENFPRIFRTVGFDRF